MMALWDEIDSWDVFVLATWKFRICRSWYLRILPAALMVGTLGPTSWRWNYLSHDVQTRPPASAWPFSAGALTFGDHHVVFQQTAFTAYQNWVETLWSLVVLGIFYIRTNYARYVVWLNSTFESANTFRPGPPRDVDYFDIKIADFIHPTGLPSCQFSHEVIKSFMIRYLLKLSSLHWLAECPGAVTSSRRQRKPPFRAQHNFTYADLE